MWIVKLTLRRPDTQEMNTRILPGEVAVVTKASKRICAVISKLMRRRSVIDIVERFQTQHALQEEREIKNFHAPTNGAVAPGVPDKNGMPKKSIPETEEVVIAEQPSLSRLTK